MTSVLSIRAKESDYLVNGHYTCYIRGNQVVITDGTNEWVISQSDIDELEQQLEEQLEAMEATLENHTHSFTDITTTIDNTTKTLDEVLAELQLGTAPLIHTHTISQITNLQSSLDGKASSSHSHSITDITNLQSSLDSKANSSHNHSFNDIYKTITNQDQTTTTKTLDEVLNEREADIRTLINGKSSIGHGHDAAEITFNQDRNVKQELDRINSRISKTTTAGTVVDIFDVIFGTAADAGLQYEVSQLQAGLAAVQGQVATLAGTYAVRNTTDEIMDATDTMADFSEVGSESRTWIDSLSDWFSSFRARIAGQTNRYTQLVNDYTVPELQSVSNAEALADIGDLTGALVI